MRALTGLEPLGALPRHPKDPFVQVLSPGKASGVLAGGCIVAVVQKHWDRMAA